MHQRQRQGPPIIDFGVPQRARDLAFDEGQGTEENVRFRSLAGQDFRSWNRGHVGTTRCLTVAVNATILSVLVGV